MFQFRIHNYFNSVFIMFQFRIHNVSRVQVMALEAAIGGESSILGGRESARGFTLSPAHTPYTLNPKTLDPSPTLHPKTLNPRP